MLNKYFENPVLIALEELRHTQNVSILNSKEIKELELAKFTSVCQIDPEIFLTDGKVKRITLHIAFPQSFPLELPRIYLSPFDFEEIKYIPHLDVNRYICLYDDDGLILNSEHPEDILKNCVNRALKIIEDGISKSNINDFEEEFLGYWNEHYNKSDKVIFEISVIQNEIPKIQNFIKFLSLKKAFSGFTILLHDDNDHFARLKNFLTKQKYNYEELDSFYLGKMNSLLPPFSLTNGDTYQLVIKYFPELKAAYEKFINRVSYPKVVIFSIIIKGKTLFFGWKISLLNNNINGFRPDKLLGIDIYTKFQKNSHVTRISFEDFSEKRISNRTSGLEIINKKNLAVVGLGSVGSNLLSLLADYGIDTLYLIDPDILKLENINRHLLGMEYVGYYKVESIKNFLQRKNPFLTIHSFTDSIINITRKEDNFLNEVDYVFIAVGKYNIEEYILQLSKTGSLTKPIFLLWIEPYLIGGHCLYINPMHNLTFKDLYENGIYKYNIIAASEYQDINLNLMLKEAGCQTSYVPYAQKNLTLFLSKLIQNIYEIIDNNVQGNLAFTYKGNPKIQESLNIKLSDFGNAIKYNEIHIQEL